MNPEQRKVILSATEVILLVIFFSLVNFLNARVDKVVFALITFAVFVLLAQGFSNMHPFNKKLRENTYGSEKLLPKLDILIIISLIIFLAIVFLLFVSYLLKK